MKFLTFKNGDKIPQLGLGTWKSDPSVVGNAVTTAIDLGYRHIDCAAIYGNESEIGVAFEQAFSGGLDRNELFVTSKLWNDSHASADVQPALKKTLSDLKLDYLDLYLMHWPIAIKKGAGFPLKGDDFISNEEIPFVETWKALEAVQAAGLVRHIGVSNFSSENLSILIRDCDIVPEMNQVEMHPLLPQKDLKAFCDDHGILMTAYSPLGSGDRVAAMKADDEPAMMEDDVIVGIAERINASPAQVLLAWAVNRCTVVIPKSTNAGRQKQNFESQFIELSTEDMSTLDNHSASYRFVNGKFWTPEGSPYTMEYLWGNDA